MVQGTEKKRPNLERIFTRINIPNTLSTKTVYARKKDQTKNRVKLSEGLIRGGRIKNVEEEIGHHDDSQGFPWRFDSLRSPFALRSRRVLNPNSQFSFLFLFF